LLKENGDFEISNTNMLTKNVMSIGKPDLPVMMESENGDAN